MLYVFVDSGHGSDTKGKHSPLKEDGTRFYEYKWNKLISIRLTEELNKIDGVKAILINQEIKDISLAIRANRVNNLCRAYGTKNCILLSIHSNAAGDASKWMTARGWSAYTTKGVTNSDKIAEFLYQSAENIFSKDKILMDSYKNSKAKYIRKDLSDGDMDQEADFYIIKKTLCPAVLIEHFFYDNKEDLQYIESKHGQETCIKVIIEGIKKYIKSR